MGHKVKNLQEISNLFVTNLQGLQIVKQVTKCVVEILTLCVAKNINLEYFLFHKDCCQVPKDAIKDYQKSAT